MGMASCAHWVPYPLPSLPSSNDRIKSSDPCPLHLELRLFATVASKFFLLHYYFGKFGSIPLKDHHFGSIPLLSHLHVGPHESMTCGVHGIYLKFGSFNGIDPIVPFGFVVALAYCLRKRKHACLCVRHSSASARFSLPEIGKN